MREKNERGKKKINYTQSTALLFHFFCTFRLLRGCHGDKLSAGAALEKEREEFGLLCWRGDGQMSQAMPVPKNPFSPISNSYSPRT